MLSHGGLGFDLSLHGARQAVVDHRRRPLMPISRVIYTSREHYDMRRNNSPGFHLLAGLVIVGHKPIHRLLHAFLNGCKLVVGSQFTQFFVGLRHFCRRVTKHNISISRKTQHNKTKQGRLRSENSFGHNAKRKKRAPR